MNRHQFRERCCLLVGGEALSMRSRAGFLSTGQGSSTGLVSGWLGALQDPRTASCGVEQVGDGMSLFKGKGKTYVAAARSR